MSGESVWWSYLGRTYPACRSEGFLWGPGQPDHPITRVSPGDLIVHERDRKVVSVSRVLSVPELLATPEAIFRKAKGDRVWQVRAAFTNVATPVHFLELREALLEVEPPDGPMHAKAGSATPGDLYPFNRAGLELVRRVVGLELQ